MTRISENYLKSLYSTRMIGDNGLGMHIRALRLQQEE